MTNRRWFAAAGALLASIAVSHADERILLYDSHVIVHQDASMDVVETLKVRAEDVDIVHGIFREFPTDYEADWGLHTHTGFQFVAAERDGMNEPWQATERSNGIRVYLGSPDVTLEQGEHTYVLHYRTERQLSFFPDHDELYWNVTGNAWRFPIDAASATVELPEAVAPAELTALGYTGEKGSKDHDLVAETIAGGALYRKTRALAVQEGMTIGLSFPKHLVMAPDRERRLLWLVHDNLDQVLTAIGIAIVLAWYTAAWLLVGRDPARGVVTPQYEPPKGFSAATLRFIWKMGFDQTAMTAELLSLAAKGALRIDQDKDGIFTIARTHGPTQIALLPPEAALLDALPDSLALVKGNATALTMNLARSALIEALDPTYRKPYFARHRFVFWIGLAFSVLTQTVIAFRFQTDFTEGVFMLMIGLTILALWQYGFWFHIAKLRTRSGRSFGNFVTIGFLLVGSLFLLVSNAFLVRFAGIGAVPAAALLVAAPAAFFFLIKAPTREGARIRDLAEGFRWYLGVAGAGQLDQRYQPQSRPDLFSPYLPYATALDLATEWSARFSSALSPVELQKTQPSWYHSELLLSTGMVGFSSDFSSSFGSSISSASTSPGSGSSSGSSGGGGGGGGGGGW